MVVKDLDEALRAAKKMGYPVVLKGMVEGQVHKTEVGLVKLNLRNADQLKSAYERCFASKTKPKSFLIQPMLKGDLELIVGIVRDPQFGPTVMLGLGGVWAEVYRDVVFRLAPLNQEEVLEMILGFKRTSFAERISRFKTGEYGEPCRLVDQVRMACSEFRKNSERSMSIHF